MTLDQIIAALKDRRLDIVSKATGLHRETLRRIRDGLAVAPTHDTVEKLRAYFGGQS